MVSASARGPANPRRKSSAYRTLVQSPELRIGWPAVGQGLHLPSECRCFRQAALLLEPSDVRFQPFIGWVLPPRDPPVIRRKEYVLDKLIELM
jgi:hypothetical protein